MKKFVVVLRNPKANSPEGDSHGLLLLLVVESLELGETFPKANTS